MLEYTIGPWNVGDYPGTVVGPGGWIASTDQCYDRSGNLLHARDDDEAQANARLIAAAPAMMKALEDIAEAQNHPGHVLYMSKARMIAVAQEAIDRAQKS